MKVKEVSPSTSDSDDKGAVGGVVQEDRGLVVVHGSDLGAVRVQSDGKDRVDGAIIGNSVVVRPVWQLVRYHNDLLSVVQKINERLGSLINEIE